MSTDPAPSGDSDRPPTVERLLTLTDGVVAIALTLLVLQLQVPQIAVPTSAAELAAQLGKDAPQLISYGISFFVIAQFRLINNGGVPPPCWAAGGPFFGGRRVRYGKVNGISATDLPVLSGRR